MEFVDLYNRPYQPDSIVDFRVKDKLEQEKQQISIEDPYKVPGILDSAFANCKMYIGDK